MALRGRAKLLALGPNQRIEMPNMSQAVILAALLLLIFPSDASLAQDDLTTSILDADLAASAKPAWRTDDFRANQALELIRDFASRFGREIYAGTEEATCFNSTREMYDPAKQGNSNASIVSNVWVQTHGGIVDTISKTMGWHKKAVENIVEASEEFASKHIYNNASHFDYVDVHHLFNIDDEKPTIYSGSDYSDHYLDPSGGLEADGNLIQGAPETNSDDSITSMDSLDNQDVGQQDGDGPLTGDSNTTVEPLPTPARLQSSQDVNLTSNQTEWQIPNKYLKLSRHRNFGDVLINTDESAVHIPVHIYPGEPQVMNGIAWSDRLTQVFRNNFKRNPKLTNQYFASQLGFMRLYPAQKWQIERSDPDLYDARMRPWYVAGASSRKDVVILVDSSGSMTGSRRDIAKGVVFEILDTLTDNDHFIILKFSDRIQQVGVPSCPSMRVERRKSSIPAKNTFFHEIDSDHRNENETDIESLFLIPANGRNVRQVKSNFTIPTSGIANFSQALVTAFEVLYKYQGTQLGSQCNQAIMLITDGSPSDFEDIFNRYNYPNAPVRVFTYLIGREAGDVTHTKMIACHNRGYYTHVINLAEVRETVQQYIPVMARPLVLNGTHPVTWTPVYGELTYQILTDWIWESKRREKARSILEAKRGSLANNGANLRRRRHQPPEIRVTVGENPIYSPEEDEWSLKELEDIDLFGYYTNRDCFWETQRNDLLTTVVQPVYDRKNESIVTEKFLVKSVWTIKESVMQTAQILGVAAADMKINDIVALASPKLGPNGYAIMLTNNGFAMHHPDLRSILEPFSSDPAERNMRILKPFFSSLDFTQVEHILDEASGSNYSMIRNESVAGITGWREILTKRTLDCQNRVQSRRQSFYYKPLQQFPFSFMIAVPQYGSHRVEAQVEIKGYSLKEKLTTYFTTSDQDMWTVHPDYQYCTGPSNSTIMTLLDMFQRVVDQKLDEIEFLPEMSHTPPWFVPGKIYCDKDLVQSLIYDAYATFSFSQSSCGPPSPNAEQSLFDLFGVRFSFIATRSGLTRVRRYDDDPTIKYEALAFAKLHSRAVDETYYSRTVDYNMLINENAILIQVPFNTHETIETALESVSTRSMLMDMSTLEKLNILTNSSVHAIATQTMIANEGKQRAVVGVSGVFYSYASFILRFLNSTNYGLSDGRPMTKSATCFTGTSTDKSCDDSQAIKCGLSNDTIDCLLIDNNGFIVFSESLEYVGRHLKAYNSDILLKMVNLGVFHEVTVTDYQSVCMKQEQKQTTSSAISSFFLPKSLIPSIGSVVNNFVSGLAHSLTILMATIDLFYKNHHMAQAQPSSVPKQTATQPTLYHLPNKTYLRPCEKKLTLYETRSDKFNQTSIELFKTRCGCESWFVYEQVFKTNLIMLILDTTEACGQKCDRMGPPMVDPMDPTDVEYSNTEERVCSMLDKESKLHRKKLDACFANHPGEEQIKICGAAARSTAPLSRLATLMITLILTTFLFILL